MTVKRVVRLRIVSISQHRTPTQTTHAEIELPVLTLATTASHATHKPSPQRHTHYSANDREKAVTYGMYSSSSTNMKREIRSKLPTPWGFLLKDSDSHSFSSGQSITFYPMQDWQGAHAPLMFSGFTWPFAEMSRWTFTRLRENHWILTGFHSPPTHTHTHSGQQKREDKKIIYPSERANVVN